MQIRAFFWLSADDNTCSRAYTLHFYRSISSVPRGRLVMPVLSFAVLGDVFRAVCVLPIGLALYLERVLCIFM